MITRVGRRLNRIMFCNERLVDLFLLLPKSSLSKVCSALDLNYSHAHMLVKLWIEEDLIIKNKAGNMYNLFYTAKGKRLADNLLRTKVFLKRTGIQWAARDEDG